MAGSGATCGGGAFDCNIIGGIIGVYPHTEIQGNFVADGISTGASATGCAQARVDVFDEGRAMVSTSGTTMPDEMGGVTFTPGVHVAGAAIHSDLSSPKVYLDAQGNEDAVFIFNVHTTLTTCAGSEIELQGGAKAENVFWLVGSDFSMGAGSIFVGNVLAYASIQIEAGGMILGRVIAQNGAVTCVSACTVDSSTHVVE
jgi:hypothetical protein